MVKMEDKTGGAIVILIIALAAVVGYVSLIGGFAFLAIGILILLFLFK